jgi:diguanylate cyclase (GGDEF)-like protein
LAIAGLGFVPLAGEVIQIMVPGTVVFCVGVTFGLFVMFVENQNQLISLDTLTKLNNRNQLNYFLDAKLNSRNSEKHLVLFVMDLDYFKQINDKYGHMEGDRSLVILSNVLKRVLGPRGFFIARIGGDEFVTVAELDHMAKAEKVMALLHSALKTESEKLPYKISLSIGYAECLPVGDTIPDLFGRADKELYKIKAQREDKR